MVAQDLGCSNNLPGNVEEVTPSGGLVKYYVAGGMALGLNTARDASGISYLASDGLGSVSEALDGNGTVTASQLYSPYGGVRYINGAMPTAKGFTGQYSDAATGLDYYGARYYDAALGQFSSADTTSDGLNRYGYVKGNPETYTDPSGHRLNCEDGCRPPKPPTTPPPTPTGGNGTGDGGCHSDGSCGCYTDCGGGNTTGGKCGGTISCDPVSPKKAPGSGCAASDSVCIACQGDGRCRAQQKAVDEAWLFSKLGAALLVLMAFFNAILGPLLGELAGAAAWLAAAFFVEASRPVGWFTTANISKYASNEIAAPMTAFTGINMLGGLALAAFGAMAEVPFVALPAYVVGAEAFVAGFLTVGLESAAMSNIYAQENLVDDGQAQAHPARGPQ